MARSTQEQIIPRLNGRFWGLYMLAWTAYGALYIPLFMLTGVRLSWAAPSAVSNVVPAALIGAAAAPLIIRIPSVSAVLLALIHAAGAVLFSLTWYLALAIALGLQEGLAGRSWNPTFLAGHGALWQLSQGLFVYGILAGVLLAYRAASRLREEQMRASAADRLRVAAELHALRAQLSPHFLFNTLHSFGTLIRHDPPAAERAVEWLGDALRYALADSHDSEDLVTLEAELRFAHDYLELERLRLGDRLRVEVDIVDEVRTRLLPRLTLQPLLENSIKHGLSPRSGGGTLRVSGRRSADDLILEVADDGVGTTSDLLNSRGLGLRLVRQRLEAVFGQRAAVTTTTAPGAGFHVLLRIPITDSRPSTVSQR